MKIIKNLKKQNYKYIQFIDKLLIININIEKKTKKKYKLRENNEKWNKKMLIFAIDRRSVFFCNL